MIMYCSCGYVVDVQQGKAFTPDGPVEECPSCGMKWNGLDGLQPLPPEVGVPVRAKLMDHQVQGPDRP